MKILQIDKGSRIPWETVAPIGYSIETYEDVDAIPSHEQTCILVAHENAVGSLNESLPDLLRKYPQDVVIVIGDRLRVEDSVELMRAGATWVFQGTPNDNTLRRVFPTILKAAEKLQEEVAKHRELLALLKEISPREREVLDLVLEGVPNKQIAKQLMVSVRTVEARRAKVYRKCNVRTLAELVRRVDHADLLSRRFGHLRLSPQTTC